MIGNRYIQQMIVPEWGQEGQRKLAAASVLIVGAGGLGTPVAVQLAAAGTGNISIADHDTISLSNLSRQWLYTHDTIGKQKAGVLASRIGEQNLQSIVTPLNERINADNIESLVSKHDLVCDCTDDAATRILIDQTCRTQAKPLVYAAVKGWEAYVTVLHHQKKITLDDLFAGESLLDNASLNCNVAGIVNTTCGIAGSIQAAEAFKIIIGVPSELDGAVLCIDSLSGIFRTFRLNHW
ncbi:HesA/MoeB/ThiF family protein [Filimonas effusa]|uniref:HesA/MoeB/ThiF family protein n=1 Tax=Filimonas effusa TaxID=2508721 RepID=A0A4Q1D9Q5_9BACT|nr:HesA/MoeB/ThiF family protein [Filimonas effusa]RXK85465.1 HesA/MoeB/ThiF family protein [Filimonas effusa]